MGKKSKTLLIIGGVVLGGVAVYMLTRPKATTPPVSAPGTPYGGQLPAGASSGNNVTSIFNAATSLYDLIFGHKSDTSSTQLPGLAQTSTGPASPAGGITYINPGAPSIPIVLNGIGKSLNSCQCYV